MTRTIPTLAAVLVLALAGCGGNEEKSGGGGATPSGGGGATPSGGGETLSLSADPGGALKFDTTKLKAKAGKVTINFDNPASIPHAVEVEGDGVEEASDTVTDGKSSLTADLKPGTYEFYCPVDAHRQQGMKGTLTVE